MREDRMPERLVDRREFTVGAALAMLSGVAITITGCGSSGPSTPTAQASPTPNPTPTPTPAPTPGPTPTPNPTPTPVADKAGSISGNHGHVAVITGAQLTAGGALTLDIQGTASHTHSVQLSASEVTAIAGGQQVAKVSSTNSSHDHTVTFN